MVAVGQDIDRTAAMPSVRVPPIALPPTPLRPTPLRAVRSAPVADDPLLPGPGAALTCTLGIGAGGETVIVAVGEIDLCSVDAFSAVLAGALDQPRDLSVVVDLLGVWFLGACAIGALAQCHRSAMERGSRLVVVADSPRCCGRCSSPAWTAS